MIIKREPWGYSVWIKRIQIGACVGMNYFQFHGINRSLWNITQIRNWRKHGVVKI